MPKARTVCAGCPLVTECLKRALLQEGITRVGIRPATDPRQRANLRERIKDRLGPDRKDQLAAQGRARRERTATVQHHLPTVNAARNVRLDHALNCPMPASPSITPAQHQQHNVIRLQAALEAA
ncbi:WhiB family transcriptional regulator [Streptomyces sp. NPDC050264]|uniref:WhiB family transcriptional regulator n=1 Tax=Streptomyces sp. NPDC050264 TaxID=3155038 RepID=UPI003423EA9E